jgi:hypothetical protein
LKKNTEVWMYMHLCTYTFKCVFTCVFKLI